MSPRSRESGAGQLPIAGLEVHPALVHVLTPEFQNINPADFDDIPDALVPLVHPDALRESLFMTRNDSKSVVSYQAPGNEGWIRIVVTPGEFSLFARHIPMLAKTAMNEVLYSRDKKLRETTGNPAARARTDQDIADSKRSAMRQVIDKHAGMTAYLASDIHPRRRLITQFKEMAVHPNLARGTNASVRERMERLRTYVFGDMLDALGNYRDWNEAQALLAARTLQKRLYLDPDQGRKVHNFGAMLQLADEYYGHKYALVRGRIAQAEKYQRDRPDVVADVKAKDLERAKK